MRPIRPLDNHGSIQLRFSVAGKRYSFHPIPGGDFKNTRDVQTATAIAVQIQNDLLSGHFDPTLDRYRLAVKNPCESHETRFKTILGLWDAWVKTLALSDSTLGNHYRAVRRMLEKADPAIEDTAWLGKLTLKASTYNTRLSYMKACYRWAKSEGKISSDPYSAVKYRKQQKPEIRPFSLEEIRAILAAFDSTSPHYSPFVRFLFLTGLRFSEALGLQWKRLDFHQKTILIRDSLAIDRAGNGYTRVRKSTKTGSIRSLPMSPEIEQLLSGLPRGDGEDLVFKSVTGKPIATIYFRKLWIDALKQANVPYRKPYTTRHTMISMAIEQGIPLTGISYLAGHTDCTMVMKTYGHLITRPELPRLSI